MAEWHIITSEYPPQPGGVSDYTHLVATGLVAEGENVDVWCPPSAEPQFETGGVAVHREFGRFSPADLRRVGHKLDEFPAPRRLLVQWVPQGYGYRSINVPFCLWLWMRAKLKQDRVEIMVHEPFLAFGEGSMKQNLAAAVHRVMVAILLKAASHVWVSIPDWEIRLRPFVLGGRKSFGWLPVPSNIPLVDDPKGVAKIRAQYSSSDAALVGHFGAYDHYMTEIMMELLPSLLSRHDKLSVMLLGKGSLELRDRLVERHTGLSGSVIATGTLSAEDVSRHISACDVMLQPYQDGVSGRRTSVMTALAHGVPVVTTIGKATESCWVESQSVALVAVHNIRGLIEATQRLLTSVRLRRDLGSAARQLYEKHFALSHAVGMLRAGNV